MYIYIYTHIHTYIYVHDTYCVYHPWGAPQREREGERARACELEVPQSVGTCTLYIYI